MLEPIKQQPVQIMAFDFGTKKMGIAVGNALIASAQPLPIFAMRDGIPDWDALFKIIQHWQPELLLVGLPLNMDDSESELSMRARKFARRLKHRSQIATAMIDERLSTRQAREELAELKQQKRAKKVTVDSFAAALFIQYWYEHSDAELLG